MYLLTEARFNYGHELSTHISEVHPNLYHCIICDINIQHEDLMHFHLRDHHNVPDHKKINFYLHFSS
jgi:hypothetical protein